MRSICVFCGSRPGVRPAYRAAAEFLGKTLAERGLELVYGGGNVGLMGAVADACLAAGGKVVGVIPRALMEWEVGHEGLSRLEVVDSMHTRKARMAELADGFIALPGGLGTFEELFEILTWAQLGIHHKPCAVLNVDGYFDGFLQFLDSAVAQGFLRGEHRALLMVSPHLNDLLEQMANYRSPIHEQWLTEDET